MSKSLVQYLQEAGSSPGHIGGFTVHFLKQEKWAYWLRHDHEEDFLRDALGQYVSFTVEQVAEARRHYLSFHPNDNNKQIPPLIAPVQQSIKANKRTNGKTENPANSMVGKIQEDLKASFI